MFGVWIDLTAKEKDRIRAADGVLAMGVPMPKSVCELQK
jgi:hypothetical protein